MQLAKQKVRVILINLIKGVKILTQFLQSTNWFSVQVRLKLESFIQVKHLKLGNLTGHMGLSQRKVKHAIRIGLRDQSVTTNFSL